MPSKRQRGFNQFAKKVRDKSRVARSVANCKSCMYLNENDVCTNNGVTSYDMVVEETRTYCTFWKGIEYNNGRKKDVLGDFKI